MYEAVDIAEKHHFPLPFQPLACFSYLWIGPSKIRSTGDAFVAFAQSINLRNQTRTKSTFIQSEGSASDQPPKGDFKLLLLLFLGKISIKGMYNPDADV